MAFDSTTWSSDTLTKASETTSETLNNATLSGTLTVEGNTSLAATSKLYLDGGVNTYMHEASADQIEVVAGGTTMLYIDNQGGSGEDEVRIPPNTKFRFGGADTI